jgi:methanogenic corrinoid protein MtbC1
MMLRNYSRREWACRCGCGLAEPHPALAVYLQDFRDIIRAPVVLTSGSRCQAHNKAVGGAKASQHMKGIAFDISMANVDPHAFEAAARRLGAASETDQLSALQVTYATGHLYALMRALRAEAPAMRPARDGARVALFATVPGEDHEMDVTVAADIFREVGWQIDLQTDTDHEILLAHIERTQPQTIWLSLSSEQRLDALVRLVVAIRLVMPRAIIGVTPAVQVDAARLHALVDIDLVLRDAPAACRELDRLICLRG